MDTGNRLLSRQPRIAKQVLTIMVMQAEGKSIRKIARETGISRTSVRNVIHDVLDGLERNWGKKPADPG